MPRKFHPSHELPVDTSQVYPGGLIARHGNTQGAHGLWFFEWGKTLAIIMCKIPSL